jgi:hypothetical protein
MATSMSMALQALGHSCDEDEVNKVMGATPNRGASWEQALATAQHYGVRATLTCPSTIPQIKSWTDAGKPVMIAWNPEGRDWSHASCVFDVTDGLPETVPSEAVVQGEGPGLYVWVADSNLPNPEKLVRIVHEDAFYSKWYEKWPQYLVRRPALMLEREITPGGRQVMAKINPPHKGAPASPSRVAMRFAQESRPIPVVLHTTDWNLPMPEYNGMDIAWHTLGDSVAKAIRQDLGIMANGRGWSVLDTPWQIESAGWNVTPIGMQSLHYGRSTSPSKFTLRMPRDTQVSSRDLKKAVAKGLANAGDIPALKTYFRNWEVSRVSVRKRRDESYLVTFMFDRLGWQDHFKNLRTFEEASEVAIAEGLVQSPDPGFFGR